MGQFQSISDLKGKTVLVLQKSTNYITIMYITKFCGEKPRRGFTTCSVCRKNSVRKLEKKLGAELKAARKKLELNLGIEKIKREHYEESKKLQEQNNAIKARIERFPIATTI